MKRNYMFILMILGTLVFLGPVQKIKAQTGDTLVVEYVDGSGNFIKDALSTAIANDVNRPEGRVYKLRKGGYYWVSQTISNSGWHLRLVGETPDKNSAAGNPAVVQQVAADDGSLAAHLITGGGDVTFKNVYFIGCTESGAQSTYQPILLSGNDAHILIDNCIFERTSFALVAIDGKNCDVTITNNVYRNLVESPGTQQWSGRGVSIWNDADSVIVENNTFFNIGFCAVQVEQGSPKYLRVNHNTFVNIGRNFNQVSWYQEAYVGNNLIVNGFWHGEGYSDVTASGRDPRAFQSGMFGIGALPTKYGPEKGRRILLANTAAWLDPKFTTYYGDTIRTQPFIGQVPREDYLDAYDNMVAVDTMWLTAKPDFPTYPSDIIDPMIQFISTIRSASGNAIPYFWQLPDDGSGGVCYTCPTWPLPENFSYTTPALLTAGTDGLPLGDLNWFPSQKASFEGNKAQYIADLQKLAGPVVKYTPIATIEAETGTVSNGATVTTAAGLAYYKMSAGYIKWTFDLPADGQYDLNVLVDLNGRGTSGVNFFVNGFEIHDTRGWGQYVFGNDASSVHPTFPLNGLNWWLVNEAGLAPAEIPSHPLNLLKNSNTIEIRASWCDNLFGGIDILQAGTSTVVKSLKGSDVTDYSIATPGILGAKWTPNWFKSVALGSNGTVAITFDIPEDGNYATQLSYQNIGSTQIIDIKADGSAATSASLEANADSSGLSYLSDAFPLTKGTHTISFTGSNINLDFVQLVQKTVTGIRDRNELPQGFKLAQNYPNPFNPTTTINFDLGKPSMVKLTIYNILGQKVATLINNNQMNTGTYSVDFNASQLSSGVYFYSLETENFKVQKKMMLLK